MSDASKKTENTPQTSKSKSRIVLIVGILFIAGIITNVVLYKADQREKEEAMRARQNRQTELKVVEMASQGDGIQKSQMPLDITDANSNAPKLPEGAMLPSNVPPEMLKALEARGMTLEDLQNASKGQGAGMGAMGGSMGAMSTGSENGANAAGMMAGGQFPEAMQKALAERNAQAQNNQQSTPMGGMNANQAQSTQSELPAYINGAIKHIEGHQNQEETTLLYNCLDILAQNENDVNALMNLAALFANHNELSAALYLLEQASNAVPNDPDVAYGYGVVLARSFKSDDAATQWEHALTLQDDAELRLDLARLYRYELANADMAKKHLELALESPNLTNELSVAIKKELAQ